MVYNGKSQSKMDDLYPKKLVRTYPYGGFHKWGTQNGWFEWKIYENIGFFIVNTWLIVVYNGC